MRAPIISTWGSAPRHRESLGRPTGRRSAPRMRARTRALVTERCWSLPLLQRRQEVGVALGLAELLQQQVHCLVDGERVEDLAQDPDLVQVGARDEDLLLARAGAVDVDG